MDTYFPKTRRPITNLAIKRPPPSVTPPQRAKIPATPTTPKDARIPRPLKPPPVIKRKLQLDQSQQEARRRPVSVRELFKSAHSQRSAELAEKIASASPTPRSPVKAPVETSGPLKGISTSLLDLIRAKEAAAQSPEIAHRNKLLGMAPEVVRIVFTVFTANKKEIMSYDRVVDKCCKGLKSNYTTDSIRDCIKLLDKIAPEWVSVVDISKGKFMRINRDNYTIPQLLEAIKRYQKEKNC